MCLYSIYSLIEKTYWNWIKGNVYNNFDRLILIGLIVRSLYDEDLDDHVMIVQDWVHKTGVDQFIPHHWDDGSNKEIFIKILLFS